MLHNPPRSARRSALATGTIAFFAVVALAGGSLLLAGTANAALIDVPATGAHGRLVLSSDPYPAEFLDISPGEPAYWQVAATLEDATSATLSLELRKAGAVTEHPRGITMTVERCSVPWTDPSTTPACAGGYAPVAVATPADDYSSSSPSFELQPLKAGSPEYLLVTLAVEDSAAAMSDDTLMGLTGSMGLGLTATALDGAPIAPAPPTGPRGPLPNTGFAGGGILQVAAFAAITAGIMGLLLVRTRMRRPALSEADPQRSEGD